MPVGAAADFHAFSRTSHLLSQLFQPLLSSSNDFITSCQLFSTTVISVHIFLTLLNSPFISLFSSQLLSTRVDSPHLSSTCPIFSQPVVIYTKEKLLREAFTHRNCYTKQALHRARFYTEKLSRKDSFYTKPAFRQCNVKPT